MSLPIAKSTRPAATAAAEPLDDPPGNAARRVDVDRRAVVRVLARQAPRHFLGVGLADEVRAGVEQQLHRGRRARRRPVRAQPVGTAEAGPLAGDVVDVLHGEGEARERPARRALHFDVGVRGRTRRACRWRRFRSLN